MVLAHLLELRVDHVEVVLLGVFIAAHLLLDRLQLLVQKVFPSYIGLPHLIQYRTVECLLGLYELYRHSVRIVHLVHFGDFVSHISPYPLAQ